MLMLLLLMVIIFSHFITMQQNHPVQVQVPL